MMQTVRCWVERKREERQWEEGNGIDKVISLDPAPGALPKTQTCRSYWGRYEGLIEDTDTSDWDRQWLRRRWQRKSWVYVGAFTDLFGIGCALVDAGYLGHAFVYVFNRETKVLFEDDIAAPFGFARKFQSGLRTEWMIGNRRKQWHLRPTDLGWLITFHDKKNSLRLHVDQSTTGISTLVPSHRRPFHYTYKATMLSVDVELAVNGHSERFTAIGLLDFSKGYPPRRTYWNWASGVGETKNGGCLGFNLVSEFNNGLENALWYQDRLIPLSQATFQYKPQHTDNEWCIRTTDGVLALTFTPEILRRGKLNFGLFKNDFIQPFGHFTGRISLDSHEEAFSAEGIVEQHEALW